MFLWIKENFSTILLRLFVLSSHLKCKESCEYIAMDNTAAGYNSLLSHVLFTFSPVDYLSSRELTRAVQKIRHAFNILSVKAKKTYKGTAIFCLHLTKRFQQWNLQCVRYLELGMCKYKTLRRSTAAAPFKWGGNCLHYFTADFFGTQLSNFIWQDLVFECDVKMTTDIQMCFPFGSSQQLTK